MDNFVAVFAASNIPLSTAPISRQKMRTLCLLLREYFFPRSPISIRRMNSRSRSAVGSHGECSCIEGKPDRVPSRYIVGLRRQCSGIKGISDLAQL